VVPLARWQGSYVGGVFVPQQGVLAVALADASATQPPGQLPVAPSPQVGVVIDRGLQVTERSGQLWVAQMVEASNASRLRVSVRALEVVDGGLVTRGAWLGPEEPATSAVAALGEVDAEPAVAVTRAGAPPTLHRLGPDGGLGAGLASGRTR
jgi:hypothetical protein